jgi:hypothetical protein
MTSDGNVVTSSLPKSVSAAVISDLGRQVLSAFREAAEAGVKLDELILTFAELKILARSVQDGAIVFISPHQDQPPSA